MVILLTHSIGCDRRKEDDLLLQPNDRKTIELPGLSGPTAGNMVIIRQDLYALDEARAQQFFQGKDAWCLEPRGC
jgi:hypothetical protein